MTNSGQKLVQLGQITAEDFIKEYWQKKPLLIKNGMKDHSWIPEINTVAGLALEDFVESRLIKLIDDHWQCDTGPFEESTLTELEQQNWSLLIQNADEWLPQLKDLLAYYDFLPQWILDDVMVSISAPGGGVGPHVDQYDVFLVQGEGKRRWKVGLPNPNIKEVIQDQQLKQVESFEPILDVETKKGDILYIPPLHPHEGVTLELSSTFSVGFRSPNQQEFLERLLMVMEDKGLGKNYLSLNHISATKNSHHIDLNILGVLQAFLQSVIGDKSLLLDTLGEFASSLKVPIMEEDSVCPKQASYFCLNHATRAFIGSIDATDKRLYLNGDSFQLSNILSPYMEDLVKNRTICLKSAKNETYFVELIEFLSILKDKGAGFFSPSAH